jgi:hypothetical protein
MMGPAVPRPAAAGGAGGAAPAGGAPPTGGKASAEGAALDDSAAPGKGTALLNGAAAAPAQQLPHPHLLWVQEHLHHLSQSAQMVSEPALRVAELRRRPWWR